MIFLVDAAGGITPIAPADLEFPGVREYAAGCTWCYFIAQAWALSRERRR